QIPGGKRGAGPLLVFSPLRNLSYHIFCPLSREKPFFPFCFGLPLQKRRAFPAAGLRRTPLPFFEIPLLLRHLCEAGPAKRPLPPSFCALGLSPAAGRAFFTARKKRELFPNP